MGIAATEPPVERRLVRVRLAFRFLLVVNRDIKRP
jgi:hypothetical protein